MATYYIDQRQTPGVGSGSSASPWHSFEYATKGAHTYYVEQSGVFDEISSPYRWTSVNSGEIKILAYKAASLGAAPQTADAKPTFTNSEVVSSGDWSAAGYAYIDDAGNIIWNSTAGYYMLFFGNTSTTTLSQIEGCTTITQGAVSAAIPTVEGERQCWVIEDSERYSGSGYAGWILINAVTGGNFAAGSATLSSGATVTLIGAQSRPMYFIERRLIGVFGTTVLGKAGPSNVTNTASKWPMFCPRPQLNSSQYAQPWRGQSPDSAQQALRASDSAEGTIVYSAGGNPTAVYGDVYAHQYNDTQLSTSNGSGGVFHFDDCKARSTISGLKFIYCGGPAGYTHRFADSGGVPGEEVMTDGFEFSGNEVALGGGINLQTPSGYTNDDSAPTTAEYRLGGYTAPLIHNNYWRDITDTIVNSGNGWIAADGGVISNNIIARPCRATSLGGIYLAGWHVRLDDTATAKRIQVKNNSITGVKHGLGFIGEGFAIYLERDCQRIDVHHNVAWQCEGGYQNNGSANIVMHSNFWTRPLQYVGRVTTAHNAGMFNFGNAESKPDCSQIVRNNINFGDTVFANFGSMGASSRDWAITLTNNISVADPSSGLSAADRSFAYRGTYTGTRTITGATKTNPVQITVVGHGLTTGRAVYIYGVGGMTQINKLRFTITRISANVFSLDGINGTGYGTYTSGGTCIPDVYALSGNEGFRHSAAWDYRSSDGDQLNFGYSTVNNEALMSKLPTPTDPTINYAIAPYLPLPNDEWDLSSDNPFGVTPVEELVLSSISPATQSEDLGTTLEVDCYGRGFESGDVFVFDGNERALVVTDAGNATATLLAADLETAGDYAVYIKRGTLVSGTLTFSVLELPPSITSIDPSSVVAGSGAQDIALTGLRFANDQTAFANGVERTLTVNSATDADVSLLAEDVENAGPVLITLYDPDSGSSDDATLEVGEPAIGDPTLTSIDPTTIAQNTESATLTLTGTNFDVAGGDQVRIDSVAQTILSHNSTEIVIQVDDTITEALGNYYVLVRRSATVKTIARKLTIAEDPDYEPPDESLPPIILGISPDAIIVNALDFTLYVDGQRFADGQVIRINGADKATTFVAEDGGTPARLYCTIESADIDAVGRASIEVYDATEGLSNIAFLEIARDEEETPTTPPRKRQRWFSTSIFGF